MINSHYILKGHSGFCEESTLSGEKVKTERQFRQQLLEFNGKVVVGWNANGTTHHAATVSPIVGHVHPEFKAYILSWLFSWPSVLVLVSPKADPVKNFCAVTAPEVILGGKNEAQGNGQVRKHKHYRMYH